MSKSQIDGFTDERMLYAVRCLKSNEDMIYRCHLRRRRLRPSENCLDGVVSTMSLRTGIVVCQEPMSRSLQQEKVLIGDIITIIPQSRFSRILDEGKIDSNDILNRSVKRDATASVHLFFTPLPRLP